MKANTYIHLIEHLKVMTGTETYYWRQWVEQAKNKIG